MFNLIGIAAIVSCCIDGIKECCTPVASSENWTDKESDKKYPEPHRDPDTGKIIIENCKLYYEDARKYSGHQIGQWVKQGKYNLTPEELEAKRRERDKNVIGYRK